MPDLPPRPLTAANAAFRQEFFRRWGRETMLVCGHTQAAEYDSHGQTLSIKAAWGGRERFFLADREVALDDDHWWVLNEGHLYASVLRNPRPMRSLAIFFRPGLADEVAAARGQRGDAALDDPRPAPRRTAFAEHLRPHGGAMTAHLHALWHAVHDGERSELWLEEQALRLLDHLFDTEPAASPARRSAQAELARRLRRAADYIDTCHREPLTLDDMAGAACLSRWHFVRHFRAAFGVSPYAFLQRKRARVARRLRAAGLADTEALAQASGFSSRFAMQRALRRHDAL
jgi:AraC-like DNA-binding protein